MWPVGAHPNPRGSGFGSSVKRFHGKTFEMTLDCWWQPEIRHPPVEGTVVYPIIYKVLCRWCRISSINSMLDIWISCQDQDPDPGCMKVVLNMSVCTPPIRSTNPLPTLDLTLYLGWHYVFLLTKGGTMRYPNLNLHFATIITHLGNIRLLLFPTTFSSKSESRVSLGVSGVQT